MGRGGAVIQVGLRCKRSESRLVAELHHLFQF